jgi:AbrB family looped-hinge helix DNA binding protein
MIEFKDGACICGTVKVGERGQIVIPKKAREYFDINAGDTLIVLGDKNKGLTIIKADKLENFANMLLKNVHDNEENKND